MPPLISFKASSIRLRSIFCESPLRKDKPEGCAPAKFSPIRSHSGETTSVLPYFFAVCRKKIPFADFQTAFSCRADYTTAPQPRLFRRRPSFWYTQACRGGCSAPPPLSAPKGSRLIRRQVCNFQYFASVLVFSWGNASANPPLS